MWWKRLKDGRHDLDMLQKFSKSLCGQGVDTSVKYIYHRVNQTSGFLDIRVTRS